MLPSAEAIFAILAICAKSIPPRPCIAFIAFIGDSNASACGAFSDLPGGLGPFIDLSPGLGPPPTGPTPQASWNGRGRSDLLTSVARLLPDPPSAKSHAHAVLGTAVQRSSSGRRTCTCGPAALRRGQEQHGPRLWAGRRFSALATRAVAIRGARREAEVHG